MSRTPLCTYRPTADEHRLTESETAWLSYAKRERQPTAFHMGSFEAEPLSMLGAEAKVQS